jgi:outer membrane lipoprotein SlyB
MFGTANYGRDNDSIASIAGAIAGALHGDGVIRSAWIGKIKEANRIDLDPIARDLSSLAVRLQRRQLEAAQDCAEMFERLERRPVA